ncbi:MAG: tRNA (cytidine(34)-2'-O)-methyltransferase [Rhodobacterales bacterium]|nr:tRNA (cytidine(34)-2'-O)-methyltransferase [Rhodobacterales bacterium]
MQPRLRLALYQPDIPQNAGTLIRTAACLGLAVDVIEPCGFLFDDRRLRRAGMDYMSGVEVVRHASFDRFLAARAGVPGGPGRLLLLTTQSDLSYLDVRFHADDTLLVGRESAGAPPEVHAAADARLVVPMVPGMRSLNVAVSAAMVLGEALRQLRDRT